MRVWAGLVNQRPKLPGLLSVTTPGLFWGHFVSPVEGDRRLQDVGPTTS